MPKARPKKRKSAPASRLKQLAKGPNKTVELLLIQSVEHLGKSGELVRVRPGYAYNYLLPQGLATVPTEYHKRMVEKHRAELERLEKARLDQLKSLAEKIGRQSVSIEANANEEGHLYGSVGETEIANALKQQNIQIAPEQVRLEGPLRELGLYTVKIRLSSEVEAEAKVWVVPTAGEQAQTEKAES